jgi:uncharacterized protein (TIGR00369 family)
MSDADSPRHGLWLREADRSMTGRAILQAVIDGRLPQAPIGRTLNFRLVEVGEGFAAFEGEPGPDHLNPMGTVHGGWVLTLIDSATACAGFSTLPPGASATTVETKANFTRPITLDSGRVRVEARIVSAGRQIVTAESWARTGDGRIVAHGTSTLLVLAPSPS